MATNMLYCHICKAMGFVKSSLVNVSVLDCGHMARKGRDDSRESSTAKPQPTPRQAEQRREKDATRRVYEREPLKPRAAEPVVVEQKPVQPQQFARPQRTTSNVAATLSDLLSGRGDKSRTS